MVKADDELLHAVSTLLLPEKQRYALWALYAWARRADEIGMRPKLGLGLPSSFSTHTHARARTHENISRAHSTHTQSMGRKLRLRLTPVSPARKSFSKKSGCYFKSKLEPDSDSDSALQS